MAVNNFTADDRSDDRGAEPSVLAWVSTVAGVLAVGLGLLVIIGWLEHIELLKRAYLGSTEMDPGSASCLILGGIGILLTRGGRQRSARAAGACILLIVAAKAGNFAWTGAPLDRLLFAGALHVSDEIPNAMPLNAGFAFVLVALGLMFGASHRRSLNVISQGFGILVLADCVFALLGLGYGVGHVHSVALLIPLPLHTVFGLAMISLGLLSTTSHCGLLLILRDNGSAGALARTTLPLAVLIPVAVGAVRLWGQNKGYYATETGIALQVIGNVVVTSMLLTFSIGALFRQENIRRARQLAVTRSEASHRLAQEVAQVGHWRMDIPSLHVDWSDQVFQITGLSREGGVPSAANILNIYHPDDRRRVRHSVRHSVREALRKGNDWEYMVRLRRSDEEIRNVVSHGTCERNGDGELTGIFGVFVDVTDLEHARRRAEEATAAKASFLANMSHEIRTPLNGVMGFAELLLTSRLDAEQERHATFILASAQTLLKLVNDILDVSKIDAGQLEIAEEAYDLPNRLSQCVGLMDPMAREKGLDLKLVVDPTLPQLVVGDSLRLGQVLINLIGNAVKFTASGSVTVEVAPIVTGNGDGMMQISVTDTGIGIPEERQAEVFEEFVQADVSTARRFGGSGLGLSISRRLVTLMGGEIKLTSREGEGTRVTVTLPLTATHSRRSEPDATLARAPQTPGASAQPTGITILLAEDLEINQLLITGMLKQMGYDVEIAADGREAIRLASRLLEEPGAYEMILMDIQMPVIDGIAATRAIRALGGRASAIPIVALTANAFVSDIAECRNAGMVDHLSKPVSMAALAAALTHWLGWVERPLERRRTGGASMSALTDKFTERKAAYETRLVEVYEALPAASQEDHELLISEAETIAHNLAGTAAIFGEPRLGEQAAVTEDNLQAKLDSGSISVGNLIAALRHAA